MGNCLRQPPPRPLVCLPPKGTGAVQETGKSKGGNGQRSDEGGVRQGRTEDRGRSQEWKVTTGMRLHHNADLREPQDEGCKFGKDCRNVHKEMSDDIFNT